MNIDLSRLFSNMANAITVVVASCALSGFVHAGQSPYAETVILNGKVITMDSDDPEGISIKQAIAISGDRIMAVGSACASGPGLDRPRTAPAD